MTLGGSDMVPLVQRLVPLCGTPTWYAHIQDQVYSSTNNIITIYMSTDCC